MDIKIDVERTRAAYRRQLDSFMNCFIMTCSPYEERQEDLERDAENRKNMTGSSWLEWSTGFCSYRTIDKIYNVQDPGFRPYLDIRLEPSSNMLTSNWFLWESRPAFKVPFDGGHALDREYGTRTRTTFLDVKGVEAQLDYLKENVGGRILDCYGFFTVNDFGKERWCYRFATEGYLREAILQAQSFVLDYLLRHPLDCFDGPLMDGRPDRESLCAGKTQLEILTPILNEYLPRISERKAFVDAELHRRGLMAERI